MPSGWWGLRGKGSHALPPQDVAWGPRPHGVQAEGPSPHGASLQSPPPGHVWLWSCCPVLPPGRRPSGTSACTSPFMKAGKLDLQGRWSGSHSSWRSQASSEDSPFPFQGRLRSWVWGGGGVWHLLPRAAGGRSPGGRGHTCSAHSVGKGARSPAWLPRRLVQGPAFAPAAGVTQVPRVWAADF